MADQRVLTPTANGVPETLLPIRESAGAANAGNLIRLHSDGRIHESMLPTGIGAEVKIAKAHENLAAGDYVNIYTDDSGATWKCRKAVATAFSTRAMGFVKQAYSANADATIYLEGTNSLDNTYTGTEKTVYLSATTAGTSTTTPPSATQGHIVQKIGENVGGGVTFSESVYYVHGA